MAKHFFGGFATRIFLVLCLLTGTGQARSLQERTFADYEIEATAIYGFAFNGTAPDTLDVDETEDLLRLTENFYKRVFASRFARSYQDVLLSYKSHDWQKENDTLHFSFDALVTFREFDLVTAPSTEEVMDAMQNIDTEGYIEGFVVKALPTELFFWTNYTNITATLKSEPSNPPTQAPVAATPTPVAQIEDNVFVAVTSPPSPSQPLIPPTLPTQGPNTTENDSVPNVTTVISVDTDAPQDQGIPFGSDPPTATSDNINEGQNQVEVEKKGGGDTLTIQSKQTQDVQNEDAALNEAEVTLSNVLTASNMFYWMAAVRVMYLIAALSLSKWSHAFKESQKKLHLESYWVQLVTHLLLLGPLAWAFFAVSGEESSVVSTGLKAFSHSTMLLLSIYGMEICLRGDQMNKLLLAHRVVIIGGLLFVIGAYSSWKDSTDLIMFGTLVALGACTEVPAQMVMIYYRFWSDSASEQREMVQPRVSFVMQLCVGLGFASKALLLAASISWYVLKWDTISESELVWIMPLFYAVQAPIMLRSFHVQLVLFNEVATTSYPEDLRPAKEIVIELGTECDETNGDDQEV